MWAQYLTGRLIKAAEKFIHNHNVPDPAVLIHRDVAYILRTAYDEHTLPDGQSFNALLLAARKYIIDELTDDEYYGDTSPEQQRYLMMNSKEFKKGLAEAYRYAKLTNQPAEKMTFNEVARAIKTAMPAGALQDLTTSIYEHIQKGKALTESVMARIDQSIGEVMSSGGTTEDAIAEIYTEYDLPLSLARDMVEQWLSDNEQVDEARSPEEKTQAQIAKLDAQIEAARGRLGMAKDRRTMAAQRGKGSGRIESSAETRLRGKIDQMSRQRHELSATLTKTESVRDELPGDEESRLTDARAKIQRFMDTTGAESDVASQYLERNRWNLSTAVGRYNRDQTSTAESFSGAIAETPAKRKIPRGYEMTAHGRLVKKAPGPDMSNQGVGGDGSHRQYRNTQGKRVEEAFPYDVDHMPGAVIRNADLATDNVKVKDFAQWSRAVNSINNSVFDDNSEFISNATGRAVIANGVTWAKWDNGTETGWFNAKGSKLRASRANESIQPQTQIKEAKGLNKKVKIIRGPADAVGKIGHVVEVRHGLYKGAPKELTIEYIDARGKQSSIQVPAAYVKLIKDEPVSEDTVQEAKGLNKKVKIIRGPADAVGKVGHVVEIRHGLYKGAAKELTIEYQDDNGRTASVQIPAAYVRIMKDEPTAGLAEDGGLQPGATVEYMHTLKSSGKQVKLRGTVEQVVRDVVSIKFKDKYGTRRHVVNMRDIVQPAAVEEDTTPGRDPGTIMINKAAHSKVRPKHLGRFKQDAREYVAKNQSSPVKTLWAGILALAHAYSGDTVNEDTLNELKGSTLKSYADKRMAHFDREKGITPGSREHRQWKSAQGAYDKAAKKTQVPSQARESKGR